MSELNSRNIISCEQENSYIIVIYLIFIIILFILLEGNMLIIDEMHYIINIMIKPVIYANFITYFICIFIIICAKN